LLAVLIAMERIDQRFEWGEFREARWRYGHRRGGLLIDLPDGGR
jgi:hypothetical protein